MRKIKLTCFFLLTIFLLGNSCWAQTNIYAVSKEKIYAQTNHVFFKPGETLYFKLYVINAQMQTPVDLSKTVYVEISNPSGNIIQKLQYPVNNGFAEGSFEFDPNIAGGIYRMKAYTAWMLNEKDSCFFTKEITVQKVISPRILMLLDFPKKGYGAGEKVSADYSMRGLNNEPIRNYTISFTVSLAGKTILTNSAKTDKEGKAAIIFDLPENLNTNDGLLNITVDYDAFTENISRSIPIVLNNIDLQFMPEGGNLIEGIPSSIAFKAINAFGKPVDIQGAVYTNSGEKIAELDSYKFGMGKFSLTPEQQKTYYAKIIRPAGISKTYPLPMVAPNGIGMQVLQDLNTLQITLSTKETSSVRLMGQTKNKVYYDEKTDLKIGSTTISIAKNLFPIGITQLTLYTSTDLPIAERLVFLNEDKNLKVSIQTDKSMYLPREKVNMTLTTTDENNKPVPANFSLSVVDDKLWTFTDDKQNHILSWLLLNSELSGTIEEPPFYFKKEEPKAIPALDLVMLTHGYRYFDFIQYVLDEKKLKFSPDQSSVLSGNILNESGLPAQADVYLAENAVNGKTISITTNKEGKFFFSDLTPYKNYFLISRSKEKKEKVNIFIEQNGIGFNPVANLSFKEALENDKFMPAIKTLAFSKQKLKDQKSGEEIIAKRHFDVINKPNNPERESKTTSEVVVVSSAYTVQKKEIGYSITKINAKELNTIRDLKQGLSGKVAGLQIQSFSNPGATGDMMIRGVRSLNGNNAPLVVINGIPTENTNILTDLDPNDIQSVSILKNAGATAVFGSAAANGAILVETQKFRSFKKTYDLTNEFNYASTNFYANGPIYSTVKKFYVPKYKTLQTEEKTDFRETIYWNPVVQTDASGTAKLEFHNGDASTTFRAIAEGIGYNGVLGRTEKTYAVQNALSVDAKIPPYLTVGDKALLPLVLKNNTNEISNLKIILGLPNNIQAGDFDANVTLAPNASSKVLIPVTATGVAKGLIQFTLTNAVAVEKVILPIEAVNKGFNVIETFAGNQTKSHDFLITKMIPGTLTSKLKLFKNLEGQLLDGIESMLREPYGCFEQTSSSTYPNIFVLKYLKESGKSNPEIEKKALGYIEKGYKRLLGFETKADGFEWFGNTPPHEALTAYGLLEFTDMQEFIDVDKKMLQRTKKFLLSKRDGSGSFTISSGGYDRFASVPNKIANIYIVYALSQAGVGNEIKKEYATAFEKAKESNDGYLMAMMALAANNMQKEEDFKSLMQQLENNYLNLKLASETSVVNSRDASLRVEALSLYALALCREKNPKIAIIASLISKILSEKSYYGYGSTQATVLALNAVVQYSKLTQKISKETRIDFILNGNTPVESTFNPINFTEGKNNFRVEYEDPKNNIPYSMEVAYQTYTPPNHEKAVLHLSTKLGNRNLTTGSTVRMDIAVENKEDRLQPMAIAKIGIPAGLSLQPWQLKEIADKNEVAYYEIFDNYLVFYWMGFAKREAKKIALDLKVEIPGSYRAKASNVYLYYTPEYKHWAEGENVQINTLQ